MKSFVSLGSSLCPACGKIKKDSMVILDPHMKEKFEDDKIYITSIKFCDTCNVNIEAERIGFIEVNSCADLYYKPIEKP